MDLNRDHNTILEIMGIILLLIMLIQVSQMNSIFKANPSSTLNRS